MYASVNRGLVACWDALRSPIGGHNVPCSSFAPIVRHTLLDQPAKIAKGEVGHLLLRLREVDLEFVFDIETDFDNVEAVQACFRQGCAEVDFPFCLFLDDRS